MLVHGLPPIKEQRSHVFVNVMHCDRCNCPWAEFFICVLGTFIPPTRAPSIGMNMLTSKRSRMDEVAPNSMYAPLFYAMDYLFEIAPKHLANG